MHQPDKTSHDLQQALEYLFQCRDLVDRFNGGESHNYQGDIDGLESILELCGIIIQHSLQGLQATRYVCNKVVKP